MSTEGWILMQAAQSYDEAKHFLRVMLRLAVLFMLSVILLIIHLVINCAFFDDQKYS